MKTVVACGVCLGLGALGMWSWSEHSSLHAKGSERPARVIVSSAELDAEQLRPVVAQEVRAALHDAERAAQQSTPSPSPVVVAPSAPASPSSAPPEPITEPSLAMTSTQSFVDQRIAEGKWSATDREHFREELAHLRPQERTQLFRQLGSAVNAGRLQIDSEEPF